MHAQQGSRRLAREEPWPLLRNPAQEPTAPSWSRLFALRPSANRHARHSHLYVEHA